MAGFFTIGEQKVRPGVYNRYENYGTSPTAGADDGKCACVLRSNWGPVDKVSILESYEDIAKIYGDGGTNGTTAVPFEQFNGGARLVYAVRLGTGGTKGGYQIIDTSDTPVIKLELKYEGSRKFNITIRPTLTEENKKELLLTEETTVLEKFTFSGGEEEAANLLEAATKSEYFVLSKLADTTQPLATVDQEEVTAGTDPTVDVAAYSAALELLEAYRFNVLALDTNDTSIQSVTQLFLNRILENGKLAMAVFGEGGDVPFETRLAHASLYNDKQVVYVGNGFTDMFGNVYEGYLAAARIAGLIAGTPSNESITHIVIKGAADLTEPLTNIQYERAISAGMLTFSLSSANAVWVESGINTLVTPPYNEDTGWKKIKRTKIRFELLQRLNDTVEPLIGRVNNDDDGRMTIIQVSNGVCGSMAAEGKLMAGARCELDPNNTPRGDSAWFLVYADDIDSLEKMYFTFKFRFAPEEAE